ncbi:MarR family transcriptional regulator [Sphingobium yanoikuyae]|uniref:MarR family transcriptional regulator n=1 Tax=Sphingobium yanoikuyae TaxID=13690 RepID=UPI002FDCC6FD
MADLIDQALTFVRSPSYIDLTARQLAIIGVAMDAGQPLRVKEMAAAIMVDKPVITRALNRMEREGLLERRTGADRRDRFIHVTDAGRAFRASIGGAA